MASRVVIAVWLSWLLIHDVHIKCTYQYRDSYEAWLYYDGRPEYKIGVCKK